MVEPAVQSSFLLKTGFQSPDWFTLQPSRLECSKKSNDVDLSVPMKVVEEVNNRFENMLYGYFLGQRLAFPVVDYYVRNARPKYGLQRVMMNAKGFFFFKFNSKKGVDDVLENGPRLIRNVPIILKPWTLNTNLLKEDLTNIPVWVKFHNVPLAMFSDDGLSLLATLIGTPKIFARCMIEVNSDEVLRESLTVEIPLLDGSGSAIEKIRVEYEWKPPRCEKCKIFSHTMIECPKVVVPAAQPTKPANDGFKTVNKKKKGKQGGPTNTGHGGYTKPVVGKQFQYQPKKTPHEPKKVDVTKKKTSDVASSSGMKISTSNQFDTLNMDDMDAFGIPTNDTNEDVDVGRTMEVNKEKSVKTSEVSQDPLVSDIHEKEQVRSPMISVSAPPPTSSPKRATSSAPSSSSTKRANPFSNVGDVDVSDSDDEVVLNTFDKSANLFGGGHEREDEFDDYDDYSKQIYDLPENLDALNAMYGFNIQGRRK
ncbi:zinc knuckle CX2CX4HX4C [Artemisia annua]|uniref:Zinc knuckle CX2CX4HX4C n=1 Tax=Artemisia annua TaxID=35608 RepID=A0A2U1NMN2_ARTAN|nr:zinc knuckle CX2CX4HX4C [Artemisia annua]